MLRLQGALFVSFSLLVAGLPVACGSTSSSGPSEEAGLEGGQDSTGAETGHDAPSDAGLDSSMDGGDATIDGTVGADGSPDVGAEVGRDAAADGGADVVSDVASDVAADSTGDVIADVGGDVSGDVLVDVAAEVSGDAAGEAAGDAASEGEAGQVLTGTLLWAKGIGTTGNTIALSVSTDTSANILVAGGLTGTADFGGGALTCPPEDAGYQECAFVAKFNSSGQFMWAKLFAGTRGSQGNVVRTDGAGNVYFFGVFNGTANFGGGQIASPSGSNQELFVAKFDSTGNYVWANGYGNAQATAYSLAAARVDSTGNVLVAGEATGSIDFGGGALGSAGVASAYLVKLNTNGAYIWGEAFPGTGNDVSPADIAIDSSGNIFVGGAFEVSVNLGGGTLTSSESSNNYNAFLAKYTSSGNHVWSKVFADGLQDQITGVGTNATGDVFVTGSFAGSINLGLGALSSAGSGNIFLGKLDPSGNGLWSKRFGDSNDQAGGPLAVDGAGNPSIAVGCYSGAVDFGGGALSCGTGAGETSLALARFDGSGGYAWAYSGGSTPSSGIALAVDGANNLVLAGAYTGTLGLAAASLVTPSGSTGEALLAKFSP